MRFTFHGKRTGSDETVTSTVEAENEAAAHDELKQRGIEVLALGVAQQQRTESRNAFRIVRGRNNEPQSNVQNPDGLLVLLSLLLPPFGFLAGVHFLCQDDAGHRQSGQRCLFASLVGLLLSLLLGLIVFTAVRRQVW